jgi:hypothetical protein
MKSSDESEGLAGFRPVGVPTLAVPPNTCSTKLAPSPGSLLKIVTQVAPHAGVAALAGSVAAAVALPAMVRVATTHRTVLLIDISNSFQGLFGHRLMTPRTGSPPTEIGNQPVQQPALASPPKQTHLPPPPRSPSIPSGMVRRLGGLYK